MIAGILPLASEKQCQKRVTTGNLVHNSTRHTIDLQIPFLLLRVLRDINMSRLISDTKLFESNGYLLAVRCAGRVEAGWKISLLVSVRKRKSYQMSVFGAAILFPCQEMLKLDANHSRLPSHFEVRSVHIGGVA